MSTTKVSKNDQNLSLGSEFPTMSPYPFTKSITVPVCFYSQLHLEPVCFHPSMYSCELQSYFYFSQLSQACFNDIASVQCPGRFNRFDLDFAIGHQLYKKATFICIGQPGYKPRCDSQSVLSASLLNTTQNTCFHSSAILETCQQYFLLDLILPTSL